VPCNCIDKNLTPPPSCTIALLRRVSPYPGSSLTVPLDPFIGRNTFFSLCAPARPDVGSRFFPRTLVPPATPARLPWLLFVFLPSLRGLPFPNVFQSRVMLTADPFYMKSYHQVHLDRLCLHHPLPFQVIAFVLPMFRFLAFFGFLGWPKGRVVLPLLVILSFVFFYFLWVFRWRAGRVCRFSWLFFVILSVRFADFWSDFFGGEEDALQKRASKDFFASFFFLVCSPFDGVRRVRSLWAMVLRPGISN